MSKHKGKNIYSAEVADKEYKKLENEGKKHYSKKVRFSFKEIQRLFNNRRIHKCMISNLQKQ